MKTMKVSKAGTIVNDDGICSPDCDWLVILSTEPQIPILVDNHFCSLFTEALKKNRHNENYMACESCNKLIAENLAALEEGDNNEE